MQIRPAQPDDLERLIDLDGTIESTEYLHIDRGGEGLLVTWGIQERPLREKLVDANGINEDLRFEIRQVLEGIENGIALAAEHDDQLVGLIVAQLDAERKAMRVLELRVDYDFRRQGLGTAMMYQVIAKAREMELRAVTMQTLTNNFPAAKFLVKAGFDMGGLDTHLRSNHDLVKEAVAMFWYAALD